MTTELKIEDLIIGTGKAAERGALITAHYCGWKTAPPSCTRAASCSDVSRINSPLRSAQVVKHSTV